MQRLELRWPSLGRREGPADTPAHAETNLGMGEISADDVGAWVERERKGKKGSAAERLSKNWHNTPLMFRVATSNVQAACVGDVERFHVFGTPENDGVLGIRSVAGCMGKRWALRHGQRGTKARKSLWLNGNGGGGPQHFARLTDLSASHEKGCFYRFAGVSKDMSPAC